MTWLLIFDHLETLQAWRIYEDNVIRRWIYQNSHLIKKILDGVTLFRDITDLVIYAKSASDHVHLLF